VAVHCVHQHNAPFVCLHTERLLASQPGGLRNVDLAHEHIPIACRQQRRRIAEVEIPACGELQQNQIARARHPNVDARYPHRLGALDHTRCPLPRREDHVDLGTVGELDVDDPGERSSWSPRRRSAAAPWKFERGAQMGHGCHAARGRRSDGLRR
jgi:hypothetical protein